MGQKVYGVLGTSPDNQQFLCVADEIGIYLEMEGQVPTPVTKKRAVEFVEEMSRLYPHNIYTMFKMKFKETI